VGEVRRVHPYPGAEHRHLHVLRKVAPTPNRFPRRPGMARKRPLGARNRPSL
jgi:16S rRNA (guanine527-N7)-methyltransferase